MDLKRISDEYQDNLVSFFKKDAVIDAIYEEQYGKEIYEEKKADYKTEYENIMANTVFIPYVTLEHLENYIEATRKKFGDYGDYYVQDNLKEEAHLLRRLKIIRDQIIEKQYTELFDEIKKISPRLNDVDFKSALYESESTKTLLTDEKTIMDNILTILDENKKQLFPLKRRKVTDLVRNYTETIHDKIIMETTTYFKHRADIPSDKVSTNLISNIEEDGQHVINDPTVSLDQRCRYIYLPILKYQDKDQYLTFAIHEVMHVSKEKITKKTTQTGFQNLLPQKPSKLKTLFSVLRWTKAKKDYADIQSSAFPDDSREYNLLNSETSFEEVTHHWQARKVVDKIKQNPVYEDFKMPYKNLSDDQEIVLYEEADITAKKFMDNFEKDVRLVNAGKMPVKEFKKKVGKTSFDNLSHLFDIWTYDKTKAFIGNHFDAQPGQAVKVVSQEQFDNAEKETKPIRQAYSNMGSMLVDKMVFHASEYESKKDNSKNSVISKTLKIAADKIYSVGSFIAKAKQEKVPIQVQEESSQEH